MKNTFIPLDFKPPSSFSCEPFHFTVLTETLATLDFDAVMSSQKRLQGIFGENSDWPKPDMTLADNIKSLAAHKQEFDTRTAFAYSVLNNAKDKCLGCIYIDPSQSSSYDCEVYLWVRNDHLLLDETLYLTTLNWLNTEWPFTKVAFPGRTITWPQWAIDLA